MNERDMAPFSILLIEDHSDTAELLSLILENEGYRVKCALSGKEAFEALCGPQPTPCNLILLDLTLPDMNGDDLIRTLRQTIARIPPIMIMSAKPASSIDAVAQAIGAAGVVPKPFDVDALLLKIRSALLDSGENV
jgi:DNA-binding response OmpR family regulator